MGEILTGYYQNPKKGLKCTGPRKAAAIDLASNNTEQKERKNRGHRGLLSWLPSFSQGQGPHSAQLLRLFFFLSSAQLLGDVWLYDPMDCSLPGSAVHGNFRQDHWSGFLFPPPGDLSDPGIKLVSRVSHWQGEYFTTEPPGNPGNSFLKIIIFLFNY